MPNVNTATVLKIVCTKDYEITWSAVSYNYSLTHLASQTVEILHRLLSATTYCSTQHSYGYLPNVVWVSYQQPCLLLVNLQQRVSWTAR